jgi:hypothetical protein
VKGKMSVKLDIAAGKENIYLTRTPSIQIIGRFGSKGT